MSEQKITSVVANSSPPREVLFLADPVVPAGKLDADQYAADDMDGVTESIFGSGNMNFLSMQASQTNDEMAMGQSLFRPDSDALAGADAAAMAAAAQEMIAASASYVGASMGDEFGMGLVVPPGGRDLPAMSDNAAMDNTANIVIGTPGAVSGGGFFAQSAPDVNAAAGASGVPGEVAAAVNGVPGLSGAAGRDGVGGIAGGAGANGFNGLNGTDGENGSGGGDNCPPDCEDIHIINVDIDLGDVVHLVNNTVNELGDIVTHVTNNVENIVSIVHTILQDIVVDTTAVICELVETVTVITTELVQTVENILTNATCIAGSLECVLTGLWDGLGLGGGVDGDTNIAAGLDVGIGGVVTDIVSDTVNTMGDVVIDPVEDLLGDLDIGAGIGLNLFDSTGTDNSAGDTDIHIDVDLDILDTGLIDIDIPVNLDSLEAIVGDIDLDLDIAANILGDVAGGLLDNQAGGTGGDTILATINDVAGDVLSPVLEIAGMDNPASMPVVDLGFGLLDGSGTDNSAGDTDLGIHVDLGLLGLDIPEIDIDIPLDPLETIVGDIDLDISAALDLLSPDGAGAGDTGGLGGSVIDTLGDWTESMLPDGGGLFGDFLPGLGGGMDALPEPVGSIAEGLGALPLEPAGGVLGKLGGLFG